MGFNVDDFPVSENYYKQAVSIPIFPSLKKEQQEFVIDVINSKSVMSFNSRLDSGFQDLF